jgi:hypothetical protein
MSLVVFNRRKNEILVIGGIMNGDILCLKKCM